MNTPSIRTLLLSCFCIFSRPIRGTKRGFDMANLSAAQVRTLKQPGRYSDGNTLLFVVAPNGRRYWLQRLTVHGKRRDVVLGDFGDDRSDSTLLTLADARVVAAQNRRRARHGEDPFATGSSGAVPTFGEALGEVLESVKNEVRTPERVRAWLHPLEKHALPRLRDIPVDRIEQKKVLAVVEPLWNTTYETARQVRRKIHRVLAWAKSHGFVDVNYAGDILDGALRPRTGTSENYRSAPYESVPGVWSTISAAQPAVFRPRGFASSSSSAPRFAAARPGWPIGPRLTSPSASGAFLLHARKPRKNFASRCPLPPWRCLSRRGNSVAARCSRVTYSLLQSSGANPCPRLSFSASWDAALCAA